LLTGRKLLLADDSAAIQKVIDLTFSDEGMAVTTVGDGRSALAELEQYPPPDVILADVFMPEPGGYELCRQIKQNERFSQIPVILLVSSFEPFDQAEADRVGADDIVTKPFQSIRQLVNRVGSLIGGEHVGGHSLSGDHALASERTEPQLGEMLSQEPTENNVTVLVEAPLMEMHAEEGPACPADVEVQTADTRPLERVTDEPRDAATTDEWRFEDTMEVEPASDYEIPSAAEVLPEEAPVPVVAAEANESKRQETYSVRATEDALLDLDDEVVSQQPANDDVFLDLDFDEPAQTMSPSAPAAFAAVTLIEEEPENQPLEAQVIEPQTETQESPSVVAPLAPITAEVAEQPSEPAAPEAATNLSPQQLDMIAKKVVERLSDKVVREIAWEVVPELAELLITKRLNEQK